MTVDCNDINDVECKKRLAFMLIDLTMNMKAKVSVDSLSVKMRMLDDRSTSQNLRIRQDEVKCGAPQEPRGPHGPRAAEERTFGIHSMGIIRNFSTNNAWWLDS